MFSFGKFSLLLFAGFCFYTIFFKNKGTKLLQNEREKSEDNEILPTKEKSEVEEEEAEEEDDDDDYDEDGLRETVRQLFQQGPLDQGNYKLEKATKFPKFKDVIGIEEYKEEIFDILDYMKNPDKYEDKGITVPKGVLLAGPPGTGKTLLANAIKNEANWNFIYTR